MSVAVIIGIIVFVLVAVLLGSQLADVFQTLRAVLRRPATGKEAIKGKTAVTKTALEPEGTVLMDGELWKAVSQKDYIKVGETVIVKKIEGLKLFVVRKV